MAHFRQDIFSELGDALCSWVSPQDRIELKRGDFIEVEVSQYPIPTVCKSSATCHESFAQQKGYSSGMNWGVVSGQFVLVP